MSESVNALAAEMSELSQSPNFTNTKFGEEFRIGKGFKALAFRDKDFSGEMDPLVMVDHYVMSEPTFGAHPHAGLSAVSVIFEDSEGALHNQDSLGNNFDIMPGDLYWLKAGAGVIHDESPRFGAKIHGLQVFVALPAVERQSKPASLHVKAEAMPILDREGSRVRVVLGESQGIKGAQSPAMPMTILDGRIEPCSFFNHQLKENESAWIYAVNGGLEVMINGEKIRLSSGQAIAISKDSLTASRELHLFNSSEANAHFALFSAEPNNEVYLQQGPFVVGSLAELEKLEADLSSGRFGNI